MTKRSKNQNSKAKDVDIRLQLLNTTAEEAVSDKIPPVVVKHGFADIIRKQRS
jgi:hypothetical protein